MQLVRDPDLKSGVQKPDVHVPDVVECWSMCRDAQPTPPLSARDDGREMFVPLIGSTNDLLSSGRH